MKRSLRVGEGKRSIINDSAVTSVISVLERKENSHVDMAAYNALGSRLAGGEDGKKCNQTAFISEDGASTRVRISRAV